MNSLSPAIGPFLFQLKCRLVLLLFLGAAPVFAEDRPSAPVERVELIDIGGRKMRLLTRGQGEPTVVIETGMGSAGAGDKEWRTVVEEISRTNRVCIYDRAGLGQSDPALKLPRTSLDVVNDLDVLLTKANIPGPYLLVGHSYGGVHARLYAHQYPAKVLGLVLVDSFSPDLDKRWLAALGAPVAGEPASLDRARKFLTRRLTDSAGNPERMDPQANALLVQASRNFGAKPVVILTHSSKFRVDKSLPEEVSIKLEEIAQELQVDLKKLSSNSTLQQSVNGGHGLHVEDPELVVQGIRQALAAVKKQAK